MRTQTPFALVTSVELPGLTDKRTLIDLSRQLERAALANLPSYAVACLQDDRFLVRRTLEAYAGLAAAGTRVQLHARGLRRWLAPGVAGVALDDDHPLVDEWVVVLVSESDPVALAATDLRVPGAADLERSFAYALTRDPEVVQACGRLLGVEDATRR
ncbi:MAG: hypothetical protein JWN57_1018 [Frankiales bacterium]|nr:hypothetical protein [Frankiales bacterium]